MFKKMFGKSEPQSKKLEIVSPITGEYVAIEDIPDPVFAQKMMGEGFGIKPTEGIVAAPISGEVVNVFPTKHAIGIKAENGVELLIHVGLETVAMKGAGFKTHISQGDIVQKGDTLLEFDITLIEKEASSIISPVIITNSDVLSEIKFENQILLTKGETPVMTVEMK
ncbi:PTS sugar transporter subunit IIA [Macrococcus armenti]|uniref:PTS sugar transporter subunit IIA n=1 Tax=Macrococcus armenti TaxID=2875764 RepID=UPI001CCA3009|nr:PTS glucose transporter subunit IIA [Macrococcus armenti]UBH14354.1 PTS glucose transporter subunit IIA [Macrococcus armenti]UBH16714.1 PTS glucose transporter subunit IIA [Macrococcus armenti]UBH18977.1 PTS glucose transporter subunit IIA [Macrococcus armenti]